MKDLMKPYSKTPDLASLRYPVIATPKYDGIRCAVEDGKLRTFNKKPVPNKYINDVLGYIIQAIEGFDGELVVKGADFNGVQSAVMSEHGKPDFEFIVFDLHDVQGQYRTRQLVLAEDLRLLHALGYAEGARVRQAPSMLCNNPEQLQQVWNKHIAAGYEGTIIADPYGHYKNGRSGIKEQLLVKLKVWHDDEATVIEVREEIGGDGQAKGRAGCLWVRHASGAEFGVPGFTDELKAKLWATKDQVVGKVVTFKYQDWPAGGDPRFPGFKGFRYD